MKTSSGNFFEDFRLGQTIRHATPRTITVGDVAVYNGIFGARFAVQSSDAFAAAIGYARAPIDDFLVFHVVFGKTVPDISLNAVANLGYANCRFLAPVFPGDTLNAVSARPARNRTARARWNMCAGLWCESATRARPRRAIMSRGCRPWSSRR
jgi:2-methylfumaryl-CoA hydratase